MVSLERTWDLLIYTHFTDSLFKNFCKYSLNVSCDLSAVLDEDSDAQSS